MRASNILYRYDWLSRPLHIFDIYFNKYCRVRSALDTAQAYLSRLSAVFLEFPDNISCYLLMGHAATMSSLHAEHIKRPINIARCGKMPTRRPPSSFRWMEMKAFYQSSIWRSLPSSRHGHNTPTRHCTDFHLFLDIWLSFPLIIRWQRHSFWCRLYTWPIFEVARRSRCLRFWAFSAAFERDAFVIHILLPHNYRSFSAVLLPSHFSNYHLSDYHAQTITTILS